MSSKIGRLILAAAATGSLIAVGSPAFAEGHGGGGHGGGAHAGGGGHAGAAVHAIGHVGGFAGAHGAYGYGGGHVGGYPTARVGYAGHVAGYGGGYYHGYSTGAYWGGGYWHGGFWPRAYYGIGFAWFLPVLPLAYATYWWDGVPYYYANDVYYTWNPSYDGYVATDPPPVTDASGAAAPPAGGSPQAPATSMPPSGAYGATGGYGAGSSGQVFMYPKNGQSEAQQSTDKRECQQWASSQADPSHVDDYRRAMMACIQGRGYSAQ